MKCPYCEKEIEKVAIYSECKQYGELKENHIVEYSSVEEIFETKDIECPECGADIKNCIVED